MRIALEHREVIKGLFRQSRDYFIDCEVAFSEEEKAIISARDLHEHYVTLPSGHYSYNDPTEQGRIYGLRLAVAAALTIFLTVAVAAAHNSPIAGFFALGWFTCIGYGMFCIWRIARPQIEPTDTVALGYILSHKRFSIISTSPTQSKDVEEAVLRSFARIKTYLEGSVELGLRSIHDF